MNDRNKQCSFIQIGFILTFRQEYYTLTFVCHNFEHNVFALLFLFS